MIFTTFLSETPVAVILMVILSQSREDINIRNMLETNAAWLDLF